MQTRIRLRRNLLRLGAASLAAGLVVGLAPGAGAAPLHQTEARIVVVGFPDLVGNGPQAPGCPGCDLSFSSGDSLAAQSDPLPILEFILLDDQGDEIERRMTSVLTDGRRPTSFLVPAPGSYGIRLADAPANWEICPNDTTSKTVTASDFDSDGRVQVEFYFWHGCQLPTATATTDAPPTATTVGPPPATPTTGPTSVFRPTATRTPTPVASVPPAQSGDDDDDDDDEQEAPAPPPAAGGGAGEIRGLVYIDANADGGLGQHEPGLGPVTVRLSGEGRLAEVVTPIAGTFSFANLPPGNYDITVVPPAGYRLTTTGAYQGVSVVGAVVMGIDFGLFPEAGLGSLAVPQAVGPAPLLPRTGALPAATDSLLLSLAALAGMLALIGLAIERRPGQRS